VVCRARGARRPLFRRSQFYAGAMLISRLLRHPPNATGRNEGLSTGRGRVCNLPMGKNERGLFVAQAICNAVNAMQESES
jgi:hypothetical protein